MTRGAVKRPRISFSVTHVVGVCLPDESPSSLIGSNAQPTDLRMVSHFVFFCCLNPIFNSFYYYCYFFNGKFKICLSIPILSLYIVIWCIYIMDRLREKSNNNIRKGRLEYGAKLEKKKGV